MTGEPPKETQYQAPASAAQQPSSSPIFGGPQGASADKAKQLFLDVYKDRVDPNTLPAEDRKLIHEWMIYNVPNDATRQKWGLPTVQDYEKQNPVKTAYGEVVGHSPYEHLAGSIVHGLASGGTLGLADKIAPLREALANIPGARTPAEHGAESLANMASWMLPYKGALAGVKGLAQLPALARIAPLLLQAAKAGKPGQDLTRLGEAAGAYGTLMTGSAVARGGIPPASDWGTNAAWSSIPLLPSILRKVGGLAAAKLGSRGAAAPVTPGATASPTAATGPTAVPAAQALENLLMQVTEGPAGKPITTPQAAVEQVAAKTPQVKTARAIANAPAVTTSPLSKDHMARLINLGYNKAQINAMAPGEAFKVLEANPTRGVKPKIASPAAQLLTGVTGEPEPAPGYVKPTMTASAVRGRTVVTPSTAGVPPSTPTAAPAPISQVKARPLTRAEQLAAGTKPEAIARAQTEQAQVRAGKIPKATAEKINQVLQPPTAPAAAPAAKPPAMKVPTWMTAGAKVDVWMPSKIKGAKGAWAPMTISSLSPETNKIVLNAGGTSIQRPLFQQGKQGWDVIGSVKPGGRKIKAPTPAPAIAPTQPKPSSTRGIATPEI
jgi:hypothetical protein